MATYPTKSDETDAHINAVKVLAKLKKKRENKKYKLVRIDVRTWKEVEV